MEKKQRVIYFSRHGMRADWGVDWVKTAPRPHDPPLSAEGLQQAAQLASYYKGIHQSQPISRILCSPLIRTLQTASAIAEQLDLPIGIDYTAMEWYGTVLQPDSLPIEELKEQFPRIDTAYTSTVPPPELRTQTQLHQWCQAAITQLTNRFNFEDIIIVSHAAPIIALTRGLTSPKVLIRTGVCSVTKLVCDSKAEQQANKDIAEKVKKDCEWVVELNGFCGHLSNGEQYHWTFNENN